MTLEGMTSFEAATTGTIGDLLLLSNGTTEAAANRCTDRPTDELAGISLKYNGIALVPVGLALTIVTIVTAVGNLLVGMALVRYRQLRTISNCLIGNLAVSDFLLAVTVLPLSATYECLGYWVFGRVACKTWLVIDVLYCTASIWNLCVIAADRFTATMYPLWYRDRRSSSRAIVYVAVVWVVAGATCVPPLIGWTGENYKFDDASATYQCTPFQDAGYVVYSASTSFFVPFLVTCALYAWIFVVLRRRFRAMRARRQSAAMGPSREAAAAVACGASKRQGVTAPISRLYSTVRPLTSRCWTALVSCRCRLCRRPPNTSSRSPPMGTANSQLEGDESSAAKSALFSECSEDKTSPVDTQTEDRWNSPETNMDSTSGPFQGHTNNNKKRFRNTVAGRHGNHVLRAGRPEVWSLSSGGCDLSLTTNAADCFVSSMTSPCDDGVTSNAVHFDKNCYASSSRRRKSDDVSGPTSSVDTFCQLTNGNEKLISKVSHYSHTSPDGATSSGSSPVRTISASDGLKSGIANKLPIEDEFMPQSTGNDVTDVERPAVSNDAPTGAVVPEVVAPKLSCDQRIKSFLPTTVLANSSSSQVSSSQIQSKQRDRSERREMRATIRMAVIIGVFGAMWIGFFVLYVTNGVTSGSHPVPPALDAFLFWLGYANSTINPILYAVFNVDFRRAFIGIITGCCCCGCCCCGGSTRDMRSTASRGAGPRRKSSRLQTDDETKLDFRSALGLRRHIVTVNDQFSTATGVI